MKTLATFGALSLIGTLAHYLVLIAWVESAGLAAWPGSIVGASAGLLVNYVLHARFTFGQALGWASFGRFALSGLAGFVVNAVAMAAGLKFMEHYLAAQLLATLCAFTSNYLLAKFWVFRPTMSAKKA